MKQLKIILLSLFISLFGIKSFAQLQPSIYTGVGLFTNLGGIFGIGSEVKYKSISFNAATGLDYILDYINGYSIYSIDVGVKWYLSQYVYAGVNYDFSNRQKSVLGPFNNFTFSLGYRHTIYKHLYGMGYLGVTSDYLAFMPKEQRKGYALLRYGLIIGYEF